MSAAIEQSEEQASPTRDVPELSQEARDALTKLGYQPEMSCPVCSRCGQLPSMVATEHPLQQKINKARRQEAYQKIHPYLPGAAQNLQVIEAQIRTLRNRQRWTSRCCGARLEDRTFDHHMFLWRKWLQPDRDSRDPIDKLRVTYGPQHVRQSDDFIFVSQAWNLPDNKVEALVRIFAREEEMQRLQTLVV